MAPRKRLHSVKIFPTKSACFREEKKANDPSYATWSSVCSICTIVFLDTWVSFCKWAKRMASFEMRYAFKNQFISWISVSTPDSFQPVFDTRDQVHLGTRTSDVSYTGSQDFYVIVMTTWIQQRETFDLLTLHSLLYIDLIQMALIQPQYK